MKENSAGNLAPRRVLWLSDANAAHTRRWVEALAQRGIRIVVFSLTRPYSDWSHGMRGVDLISADISHEIAYGKEGGLGKLRYLRTVPQIRRIASDFAPHVFHAHYTSSYGLLATFAGLRPRIVSVWGADVYTAPDLSLAHRWLIRKILRSADAVLSTSRTMRDRVLTLLDRSISVVPFGIDTNRFSPAEDHDERGSPLIVGTVKSLEAKYGIETFLKAIKILKQRNPTLPLRLLIVGGGSLRQSLERLSVELGVDDITEFAGRIDYDEIHRYHQKLDVAVYPSIEDSESFGVSVVESMACGVPVVVSRVGGLPEVVEENETGLVVPAKQEPGLADAIERLCVDDSLRRKFGQKGRARAVSEYSIEHAVDLLISHYQNHGLPP